MSHEVLPGELSTFRAVGATGFGLGAAGGVALWLTQPEEIGSGGVAVLTTVLCVTLAAAMALVPWQRIPQGWQLAPPLIGAAVIAVAIQNRTAAGRSTTASTSTWRWRLPISCPGGSSGS